VLKPCGVPQTVRDCGGWEAGRGGKVGAGNELAEVKSDTQTDSAVRKHGGFLLHYPMA
jgi:hypothetical protein